MRLAADANVLLSAVIGGRARLVLSHPQIEEVVTTESVFAEIEEYAAALGQKRKIPAETLMLAVASLPVSIVAREVYAGSIARARKRIGWRDQTMWNCWRWRCTSRFRSGRTTTISRGAGWSG